MIYILVCRLWDTNNNWLVRLELVNGKRLHTFVCTREEIESLGRVFLPLLSDEYPNEIVWIFLDNI